MYIGIPQVFSYGNIKKVNNVYFAIGKAFETTKWIKKPIIEYLNKHTWECLADR